MRVELSDGGWAELRTVKEISEGRRRPISKAISQLSPEGLATMEQMKEFLEEDSDGNVVIKKSVEELASKNLRFSAADLDIFSTANDYCILALVKQWDVKDEDGRQLPLTMEAILNLKAEDYDRLRLVCAPAAGSLFVNFVDGAKDPQSPFVHSNGSSESSKEVPSSMKASPSPSGETGT